jgi:hypothetical protein
MGEPFGALLRGESTTGSSSQPVRNGLGSSLDEWNRLSFYGGASTYSMASGLLSASPATTSALAFFETESATSSFGSLSGDTSFDIQFTEEDLERIKTQRIKKANEETDQGKDAKGTVPFEKELGFNRDSNGSAHSTTDAHEWRRQQAEEEQHSYHHNQAHVPEDEPQETPSESYPSHVVRPFPPFLLPPLSLLSLPDCV